MSRLLFALFLFCCTTVRQCGGLQAASGDFDIYPSSFDDLLDGGFTATESVAPATKGLRLVNLWSLLRRIGVIGTAGAGAYVGYRGCKIAHAALRKAHAEWKEGRRTRAKKGKAAAPSSLLSSSLPSSDMSVESIASSSIISTSSNGAIFNATAVDELKKEQEELWRFLHSLFKSQDGIISRLDKLAQRDDDSPAPEAAAASAAVDSALREVGGRLEAGLAGLAARVDELSAKVAAAEAALTALEAAEPAAANATAPGASPDTVRQLVRAETQELAEGLQALRRDVKAQLVKALREHDDTVVEKIKVFGDDMKKFVKGFKGTVGGGGGSGVGGGKKASR